jgi:hypothetical protein
MVPLNAREFKLIKNAKPGEKHGGNARKNRVSVSKCS